MGIDARLVCSNNTEYYYDREYHLICYDSEESEELRSEIGVSKKWLLNYLKIVLPKLNKSREDLVNPPDENTIKSVIEWVESQPDGTYFRSINDNVRDYYLDKACDKYDENYYNRKIDYFELRKSIVWLKD